jgi:hypothetical protein
MAKPRCHNHFLPECYQRAFADSSGRVWVKYANVNEPVHQIPEKVGRKRGLYVRDRGGVENDEVELFFDRDVEKPFAALARRFKAEQDKLSSISAQELGALARFVASQAVRTLAHKQCVGEQAGRPVDSNTFVRVALRQIWTIWNKWLGDLPTFDFYTSLPHVGDRYLTGDHPVLVVVLGDSPILLPPGDAPRRGITGLTEILASPGHGFLMSLSPYLCVSIHARGDGRPHLPPKPVYPRDVRFFNSLVRDQCELFTLARDRESLT